jgi:hypothetical protein
MARASRIRIGSRRSERLERISRDSRRLRKHPQVLWQRLQENRTWERAAHVSNRCAMFDESANTREDGVMNTTNSIASTPTQPFDTSVPWLETQAEVTACRYEFSRMNTLSLGFATSPNQFMVSFSYYAHAKTFCDEFTSPVAMGMGETFPVFYNPLNPKQNSRSEAAPTGRVPRLAYGVAGSIVISLLYLAMMGGCQ